MPSFPQSGGDQVTRRRCPSVRAAAEAATPAATPGHLVEALKPSVLTLDASPIEMQQWKGKLVMYFRSLEVPNQTVILNHHSVFFWCIESAVEDRVMHHDQYCDNAGVLPAELVPDCSSLAELLDEVYLEEVPLFNRRLEFFQMPQRTGEGKTVEQFVEPLEARAREAEVHLMTQEDLIMPLSETTNSRLQRLCLKVVEANVRLAWEGGKHNIIVDTLSRAPVSAVAQLNIGEQQKEAIFVRALVDGDMEVAGWLFLVAKQDNDYQRLLGARLGGA